ncbi:MAG: hypothetical protein RIS31_810 [Actinomycetota bacterium]|jgi:hypothetical protein
MAIKFIKTFGAVLIVGLSLTACSASQGSSLSLADAQRLATAPKVEGYVIPPSFSSEFTGNAFRVFVLGQITEVRAPKTSCMADGEACFEYVPVEIRVIASKPSVEEKTIVLRSFPTAEFAEDPRLVQVGDVIVANPAPKTKDSSGIEAYSLGTMFKVDGNGVLRLFQKDSSSLGTLKEVDEAIGSNFEDLHSKTF